MGLLSRLKKIFTGKKPEQPEAGSGSANAPKAVTVPKARPGAKPAVTPGDVKVKKNPRKIEKEEKPVAEKITIGHVHMSGCTGCLVSLADNYGGLFTLLDNYADLNYCLTLADVRDIPKMDVALVEEIGRAHV